MIVLLVAAIVCWITCLILCIGGMSGFWFNHLGVHLDKRFMQLFDILFFIGTASGIAVILQYVTGSV